MSAYGEVEKENERDPTERDRRLESTYHYERDKDSANDSELSTPAFVSAYKDQLAMEFFSWLNQYGDSSKPEVALIRWEGIRFGASLELVCHQMLWFAVRSKLVPDDRRYQSIRRVEKPIPNRPRNLSDVQRRDRMLSALDKMAESKSLVADER